MVSVDPGAQDKHLLLENKAVDPALAPRGHPTRLPNHLLRGGFCRGACLIRETGGLDHTGAQVTQGLVGVLTAESRRPLIQHLSSIVPPRPHDAATAAPTSL